MAGALDGIRVIELAGIGPAPFAAMMLADHGAAVIRVEREDQPPVLRPEHDIFARSRASVVSLDLKSERGIARVRELTRDSDGLIEGFRPGVMERLGLGPDQLLADNERLVYGRMTGWGQDGPLASAAGHDIDYIALAGALHTFGRAGGPPVPPGNAVGDFGGGGMMLAFGMLAGILSARTTGKGQVIDCAMVDGAALLASLPWALRAMGKWKDERGANLLDGGTPYYDVYQCADGEWVAVGAIEPAFFAVLKAKMGLESEQQDPGLRSEIERRFRDRPRDEWCCLLEGSDACFAPILSLTEAADHPHNRARGTFITAGGVMQPGPAPRFSGTPAVPPRMPGTSTNEEK